MMNLQGKIAGFDFYEALDKLTDNAGLGTIKVNTSHLITRHATDISMSLFRIAMSNLCASSANGCS